MALLKNKSTSLRLKELQQDACEETAPAIRKEAGRIALEEFPRKPNIWHRRIWTALTVFDLKYTIKKFREALHRRDQRLKSMRSPDE